MNSFNKKEEKKVTSIKTKGFEVKKNYFNLKKGDTINVDAKGEKFYKSLNII